MFFFPLSNEKNEKQEDAFKEVITSCRSLSSFETNSLKTASPQVRSGNAIRLFAVRKLSPGNKTEIINQKL